MDSRPILKNTRKIQVFLDTNTFNELFDKKDRLASAIVMPHGFDYLEFVRSPLETSHGELKKVPTYELYYNNSEITKVKIEDGENSREMVFWDKIVDIQSTAQSVFNKDDISDIDFNIIIMVFIQAVFNRIDNSNIFITNEKNILKNRLLFESNNPGEILNIMSVEEASHFLDLFFKVNGEYNARINLNKGYWYWLSMRLKVQHFNVGDKMIDALAQRLCYALMALDEMGIQYYLGVNKDTRGNTLYHFNYLISLITGIFDNLALKTDDQLGINFPYLNQISLSKKSGKAFFKEIRRKNTEIRDHIHNYVDFIRLIYSLREPVIHREGLDNVGFKFNSNEEKWEANFLIIPSQIKWEFTQCGDTASEYDPISMWGVYETSNQLFLDPYNFSRQALTTLVEFIDRYLQLLGYPSYIKKQKQKNDEFTRTLNFFEKYHLGF